MENLIPGLESPGPIYVLPSCFDRASIKSKHPLWGPSIPPAHKQGRYREDEVRFSSARHMRELKGHFSPGPQYSLPSCIGGATGNALAASARISSMEPQDSAVMPAMPYTSMMPPPTTKLSATQLGGTSEFTMTRGSHADPERKGGTAAAQQSTEFWRSATMLQPQEMSFHNAAPDPSVTQPWHATVAQVGDTAVQDEIKKTLSERWRPEPKMPRRQVPDYRSDPPLANVFGSGTAHTDFGVIGGMDRAWRESKINGGSYGGTKFGTPLATGTLRYAFVQKTGPNSVPHGVSKAEFDGGRTNYGTLDGSMARTATATSGGTITVHRKM